MAFWTACCSAGVGAAGAAPESLPEELAPPPEPEPLPEVLTPPPEVLPPPVPPPPVWPPPPLFARRRLLSAARRARLMTSRQAVYWSLSAGSWLRAFLYVRCEYVPSTFSSRHASTSRSEALSPATAWAAGSSRSSRNVAMTSRRIGQAQRRFPCRSVRFTLAAAIGGRAVEGGRETGRPRLVGVRRHGPGPCL